MEVVGWGSPVGLTIFLVGLAVTVVLLAVAARVFSGKWLK